MARLAGDMWVVFAFGAAGFAGLTAILAKIGVRGTPSHLATAIRTVVVLGFAWLVVLMTGSQATIGAVDAATLGFLVLSGLATGASWLCYFKALQLADVNQVTPIDKSSIILTVLFAILFLGETENLATRLPGIAVIGIGTYLMIEPGRRLPTSRGGGTWLLYAGASAVFAALTTILGKVGIGGVDSNLGTALRTIVVLAMAAVVAVVSGEHRQWRAVPRRDLAFILLSGVATGASWLCFYRALAEGPASLVAPIDRLSIVVTIVFASVFLRERLTLRAACGLALILAGTFLMLV
ncbi:MAG: EamA family transporter [Propionicimonas sp.]|nr:EamA family transporter [Propionicimonas sp.]